MKTLGYYAKDKDTNLFQYEWGAGDEFYIQNCDGEMVHSNPDEYEVIQVGVITTGNPVKKEEQARQTLKEAGYFVDNLWSIHDVMDRYECTEEEAQEVLESALTNGWIVEQIHLTIANIAEDFNLKEKEDEDNN